MLALFGATASERRLANMGTAQQRSACELSESVAGTSAEMLPCPARNNPSFGPAQLTLATRMWQPSCVPRLLLPSSQVRSVPVADTMICHWDCGRSDSARLAQHRGPLAHCNGRTLCCARVKICERPTPPTKTAWVRSSQSIALRLLPSTVQVWRSATGRWLPPQCRSCTAHARPWCRPTV